MLLLLLLKTTQIGIVFTYRWPIKRRRIWCWLQTRPTPLLGLIYCRRLNMRRSATGRTAAGHVGTWRWVRRWLLLQTVYSKPGVKEQKMMDGKRGEDDDDELTYEVSDENLTRKKWIEKCLSKDKVVLNEFAVIRCQMSRRRRREASISQGVKDSGVSKATDTRLGSGFSAICSEFTCQCKPRRYVNKILLLGMWNTINFLLSSVEN